MMPEETNTPLTLYPEPCPQPTEILLDGCRDAAIVNANDAVIGGLGRIVQVDATVRQVCPGRKLAVAVILTELDQAGNEQARGTKTLLIPAQTGEGCRDLVLKCINFVVPEDGISICSARSFRARVLANYVETDFVCCEPEAAIL